MRRHSIRWWSRLLALAMLWSQLALSAYACPLVLAPAAATPGLLAPAAAVTPSGDESGPCMRAMRAVQPLDPAAPLLCAEHCKGGLQNVQCSTLHVPMAALHPLHALYPLLPSAQACPALPAARASTATPQAPPPPHALLHCVYRI